MILLLILSLALTSTLTSAAAINPALIAAGSVVGIGSIVLPIASLSVAVGNNAKIKDIESIKLPPVPPVPVTAPAPGPVPDVWLPSQAGVAVSQSMPASSNIKMPL